MIVMEMRWEGITPDLYDEVKRRVNWDDNPNPHGHVHLAWFENGALRCCDVWDSAEAFAEFSESRLKPALGGLDIASPPEVRFHEVHDTFVLAANLALAR